MHFFVVAFLFSVLVGFGERGVVEVNVVLSVLAKIMEYFIPASNQ